MIFLKKLQLFPQNVSVCYVFIPIYMGIFFLLSACAGLNVTPETVAENGPQVSVATPVYDFGYAGPGMQVRHSFQIKNSGTEPLIIAAINSDCGCIATLLTGKEIFPGESGSIQVSFETKKYEGKQKKNIIINSNDPDNKELVLTIKGMIKKGAVLVPQAVNLGDIPKGTTATGKVKLLQLSKNQLVVLKIDTGELISAESVHFRDENSRGYEIKITLSGSVAPGPLTEVITLHTNLPKQPRIDVPIWANIVNP